MSFPLTTIIHSHNNVMNQIKTFEEACTVQGIDPVTALPDVSGFPEQHRKALTATGKLFIIADALNEGWKPDWNNDDEYKYYPWFDLEKDEEHNPSGFRLDSVYCSCTRSTVGSRLCFKNRAIANYAGTQFTDLYRDLMVH
jgi:hypothetical protein